MKPEEIERQFASGDCIVEPGEPADAIFIVHDGMVRVYPTEDDAPRLISKGEIFGETAAILGRPYAFRAEAESDAVVLAIELPLLNRLCRENSEFSFRLIRHLADQLGQTQHVATPAAKSPRKRKNTAKGAGSAHKLFIRAILDSQISGDAPAAVRGRLADLAELAGVSMRDAYVCLQGLLDARQVRLVDDQLAVLEVEALEALAA